MNAVDLTTPIDPLERTAGPERVNYATGVLLQAEDFRDEQTYHRGRLAAALRHLIGYGTLAGLAVRAPVAEDNELELRVEPGVALDRHGRLLELRSPYCIRLARWFAAEDPERLQAAVHVAPATALDVAVVVDIFLSAGECASGKTPSFATGPFDALDAVVPARLKEDPRLELVLRLEDSDDENDDGLRKAENFWPAPNASRDTKLKAVLGSWDTGLGEPDGELDPLQEHVEGMNFASVLLARIAIPVTDTPDAPPELDLTKRTIADNGVRPFIYLPGKWLGRPAADLPITEP